MYLLNYQALPVVRALAEQRDPRVIPALERLRDEADVALKQGPWSVTFKKLAPPSGDMHDYMSVGVYWWPDPAKSDGMPFIRRDGEPNPDYAATDGGALQQFRPALDTLCLAYGFTGDEQYAQRAAMLLRTWFLDDATRMNPHLRYAQAIPGICDGRGIGIVDTTQGFSSVANNVLLLRGSSAWTESDDRGLVAWMSRYLDWLLTDEFGNEESRQRNNHGTWYDLLVISLAQFTGRPQVALRVLSDVPVRRIALQIEPDGRQPAELKRTIAFTYSVVNLLGFFHLAAMGESFEIDLWNAQTNDGRSIRKALDWIAPYADPRTPWPYQQIHQSSHRVLLYAMLRRASTKYQDLHYRQILGALPDGEIRAERFHLLEGPLD